MPPLLLPPLPVLLLLLLLLPVLDPLAEPRLLSLSLPLPLPLSPPLLPLSPPLPPPPDDELELGSHDSVPTLVSRKSGGMVVASKLSSRGWILASIVKSQVNTTSNCPCRRVRSHHVACDRHTGAVLAAERLVAHQQQADAAARLRTPRQCARFTRLDALQRDRHTDAGCRGGGRERRVRRRDRGSGAWSMPQRCAARAHCPSALCASPCPVLTLHACHQCEHDEERSHRDGDWRGKTG